MLGSETLGPRNESEALTPHWFSLGRVGPGGESRVPGMLQQDQVLCCPGGEGLLFLQNAPTHPGAAVLFGERFPGGSVGARVFGI